jgi:hypothetical protein
MIAYKGFDNNWSCRGFKYEVGKTYTHDGDIYLCSSGFHACEAPLDVWNYYPINNDNQYALVELDGVSDKTGEDTKRVAKSITVKASLTIPMLIQAQIEWTFNAAKESSVKGDGKHVSSSGYSSTAASSGGYSTAASSGDSSTAASSGDSSKAASSGDYSTAASSGDSSKAASSGGYSKAASSGDYSTACCDTNGFACVVGINGRVKGNAGSALSLGYLDSAKRNRIAVGYVGEDGIKADNWYEVQNGKLVECK